jgi:hypothetical protein
LNKATAVAGRIEFGFGASGNYSIERSESLL